VSAQDFEYVDTSSVKAEVVSTARMNVYLVLMAIPGYYIGVYLIDKIGRRPLQLWGFIILTVLYVVVGSTISALKRSAPAFFLLYGLTFLVGNAGPNTTTFVLPSESFPTEVRPPSNRCRCDCRCDMCVRALERPCTVYVCACVRVLSCIRGCAGELPSVTCACCWCVLLMCVPQVRATCHGLSAAAGKIGAVIGASLLQTVKQRAGLSGVMFACAVVAALGAIVTYIFTEETMGRSLEHITVACKPAHADVETGLLLAGWTVTAGGSVDTAPLPCEDGEQVDTTTVIKADSSMPMSARSSATAV
jgi:nitrate/nitrite transporter NarK